MSFGDGIFWWFGDSFVMIFMCFWCPVWDKWVHVVKNVIFVLHCVFRWILCCFVILVSIPFHVCGRNGVNHPTCFCVDCLCYVVRMFASFWEARTGPQSDKIGSTCLCFLSMCFWCTLVPCWCQNAPKWSPSLLPFLVILGLWRPNGVSEAPWVPFWWPFWS